MAFLIFTKAEKVSRMSTMCSFGSFFFFFVVVAWRRSIFTDHEKFDARKSHFHSSEKMKFIEIDWLNNCKFKFDRGKCVASPSHIILHTISDHKTHQNKQMTMWLRHWNWYLPMAQRPMTMNRRRTSNDIQKEPSERQSEKNREAGIKRNWRWRQQQ